MKVINKALLKEFSLKPACEGCGVTRLSGERFDAHHVRHKGSGRVDVRENLAALYRVCHTKNHAGNEPTTEQLLELVAHREGRTVEAIRRKIDRIRRDTSRKVWLVE